LDLFHFFFSSKLLQAFLIKGILRPSHVCFICGTLPTGTLIVCIPNLFPPKEKHNVGLLRFDDDQDHICYRFAQVQIFGGKSNVFKSLHCIYILQCVLYMYKNKDNYCSLNHSHLTRHHNLLLSIHSRLHKTQNSTRYYCVKFYNALPLHLKNMDFKPFKQHLQQLLTKNAFYSFEEFYSFTKSL
jgi:hypothetical protein